MSSGSGTYHGFYVEVRLSPDTNPEPVDCFGTIISKDWKRVPVGEALQHGFRNELWEWHEHAHKLGLLPYPVALGIAAQFHAQCRQWNFLFEFRMIQVKVEYTFKTTQEPDEEIISFNNMETAAFKRGQERRKTATPAAQGCRVREKNR